MLKKTSAYTGLVIVTAAGALLASSPAYALDGLVRGSHSSSHHRSHHRNRNWNGNRHHGRIFIRIYIYNKNNNRAIAVARPEHRRSVARRESLADPAPVSTRDLTTPAETNAVPSSTSLGPATASQGTTPADTSSANSAPATSGTAAAPEAGGSTSGAGGLDEAATGGVSP